VRSSKDYESLLKEDEEGKDNSESTEKVKIMKNQTLIDDAYNVYRENYVKRYLRSLKSKQQKE
jgi:hypothetical protein